MEIKVNLEELKKNKLFIGTPCYAGMCNGIYTKSCLDLQNLMSRYGIETKFSFLFNESLITRARNYIVDEFLRSGFTHLLFIDSDISFSAQDVLALMALDKDVIGAPYPKKSINWANVKQAVLNNPNIEPRELENVVGEYVFNVVQGTESFNVTEPLEVMEIGTGFMMIKRHVFDKMKEAYPTLEYKPDHIGQANFDGSRMIHAYFDTMIDTPDSLTGGGSMRYYSEDYSYCNLWRKIGGKVWLCPWMQLTHVGTYGFTGNMPAVAGLTGKL